MRVVCPQCSHQIESVEPTTDEVLCSACASSFGLERGTALRGPFEHEWFE
jgi:hypothetical protein